MGFTASQKAEFEKLYKCACDASEARLVQLKDSMIKIMIESGVARIKHLPCDVHKVFWTVNLQNN